MARGQGRQRDRAKVQIGAVLLCKGAKVNSRVLSIGRCRTHRGQHRETGGLAGVYVRSINPGFRFPSGECIVSGGGRQPQVAGGGKTSSGLRSRQSGIRFGLSGSGTGAGPEPAPGAEHLNPGPDGRDPGPENG